MASDLPTARNPHSLVQQAMLLSAAMALCLSGGCVSPKYKRADKNVPPAVALNVAFPPAAFEGVLLTEISYGGPGSWKREAFWDEYIVTIHNPGTQPLEISTVSLTDYAGAPHSPGDDPWALERESKTMERRYRDNGIDFARMAAPHAAAAAEPGVAAGVGVGSAGAAAAATATAVAVPVYGLTVFGINMHNRKAIKKEFNRRRLSLPLRLSPGETRSGSFFFPMVPNPQALTMRWSNGSGDQETSLKLDVLQGLHVTAPNQH